MPYRLLPLLALAGAALASRSALADTLPSQLSLSSLAGVFPGGSTAAFSSFSTVSFAAANTPYNDGQIGMTVSFGTPAASPTPSVAGGDSLHATGYDNTPATVTLLASSSVLVGATTVPEPASIALLTAGALGLLAVRIRRRRA